MLRVFLKNSDFNSNKCGNDLPNYLSILAIYE